MQLAHALSLAGLLLLGPARAWSQVDVGGTLYGEVLFRNGRLTVNRQPQGLTVLQVWNTQTPPRGGVWAWDSAAAASAGTMLLQATETLLDTLGARGDTLDHRFPYIVPVDTGGVRTWVVGATRVRCARAVGCWATIANLGRSSYWRPSPNLMLAQAAALGQALIDAATNRGTVWRLDLRE